MHENQEEYEPEEEEEEAINLDDKSDFEKQQILVNCHRLLSSNHRLSSS